MTGIRIMTGITHENLVKHGLAWLKRRKCVLILTEMVGGARESPDVFGVNSNGTTVLIECKATRSDFLSDAKKIVRQRPNMGIGMERFYLAPKGLLNPDELPAGWGLLESDGKKAVCRKRSDEHEHDSLAEKAALVSMVRRLNLDTGKHTSLKVLSPYTLQTKCKATLSLAEGGE